MSGVLRSCTIIFMRSSRIFSTSRSLRSVSSSESVAALSLSRLRTRAPSTRRLCGFVRKSSPPASIAFTRSVVSFSAVTKMTGMLFVRGSRLMRRQTSKPVDRSSTPRSPAGIDTSRMQRSGRCSKHAASADGPSDDGDGAEAEHVQLIEQQLDVRRARRRRRESAARWPAVRCFPRGGHGRTVIPKLRVHACSDAGRSAVRDARINARSVKHVSVGKCGAESRR